MFNVRPLIGRGVFYFGPWSHKKKRKTGETMDEKTKFILNESDIPRAWYNINADAPVKPAPVFNPIDNTPVTPEFLSVLFPMSLIEQEVSMDRYIDIPEEVREVYKLWRPTPLIRARRFEKALGTPAHIYFNMRGYLLPEVTNPTQLLHRPITTRSPEPKP
jgi:predicted alternative tryptophan synthase beta-subunit